MAAEARGEEVEEAKEERRGTTTVDNWSNSAFRACSDFCPSRWRVSDLCSWSLHVHKDSNQACPRQDCTACFWTKLLGQASAIDEKTRGVKSGCSCQADGALLPISVRCQHAVPGNLRPDYGRS